MRAIGILGEQSLVSRQRTLVPEEQIKVSRLEEHFAVWCLAQANAPHVRVLKSVCEAAPEQPQVQVHDRADGSSFHILSFGKGTPSYGWVLSVEQREIV